MAQSAPDIYASQLWFLGHGHPLWGPEPCKDFGPVRIGDVGYLKGGHFTFLFNAMLSADDPTNLQRGVPYGFAVFKPRDPMMKRLDNEITQPQLYSKSMRSLEGAATAGAGQGVAAATAGLRYQCTESTGALLLLKRPAHKTYMDCNLHIRRYIQSHIHNWYEFVNGALGIGLEEKDIIFISGFTKTSVWAEAAFNHGSSAGEIFVGGSCFVPAVSGEFRVSFARNREASAFSREGPYDRVTSWKMKKYDDDQCIFVNYHKMKSRRLWRSRVIRAAAGPHDFKYDSASEEDSSQVTLGSPDLMDEDDSDVHETTPLYDPVDDILDYILENSDAQFACASDEDATRFIRDRGHDIKHALALTRPTIVTRNGYGELSSASPSAKYEAADPSVSLMGRMSEGSSDRGLDFEAKSDPTTYLDAHKYPPEASSVHPGFPPSYESKHDYEEPVAKRRESIEVAGLSHDEVLPKMHPPSTPVAAPIQDLASPGQRATVALNTYMQKRRVSLHWEETFTGPSHNGEWSTALRVNGEIKGRGLAPRKSLAKEIAAGEALAALLREEAGGRG